MITSKKSGEAGFMVSKEPVGADWDRQMKGLSLPFYSKAPAFLTFNFIKYVWPLGCNPIPIKETLCPFAIVLSLLIG